MLGPETRTGRLHLRAVDVDVSGSGPSNCPSYCRNLRLAASSYPPQVRCAVVHLRHDYMKGSLYQVQQAGRTPIHVREWSVGHVNRRRNRPSSVKIQGVGAAYATTPRAYQANKSPYQRIE